MNVMSVNAWVLDTRLPILSMSTVPLLVLASPVIDRVKTKNFTDLSSIYNLAAHVIGIIRTGTADVSTEVEPACFREDTHWVV